MSNILIVYATTLGNTGKMAESVAEGVRSVSGAVCVLKSADEAHQNDARTCDALILGSPVRHRSADARVKLFIERVLEQLWLDDEMVGKVGAVFTVGGGYGNVGAGNELAQLGMLSALAANGMILVPLPKTTPGSTVAGGHWGPNGRSGGPLMEPIGITEEMRLAGFHHGANVARVTAEFIGKTELFARGVQAPPPDILKLFQQAD
jgi:NAD(P)H dehydrogenase (quinone)